ncbi:MAG TPA: hypothetical protein VFK02_31270 [Kofleriaceae bacterium]|nr:hypothetical protein [Kofleriaceae bacterium]
MSELVRMFIGHFAVGLAAKRLAPRASLPVLLAAPQVLDIAWPIFVATGVEHARIVKGVTAASPLALDYMPYSHSLVAAALWSIGFGIGYLLLTRDRRAAGVLAACVMSHWILDWIAHAPDMPILSGDGPRYGLGLWNSIPATLVVEGAMFAAGAWLYVRSTRATDRAGAIGYWALIAVLAVAYVGAIFGPPPPSINTMVGVALGGLVVLPWAWWIDRHRQTRPELLAAA